MRAIATLAFALALGLAGCGGSAEPEPAAPSAGAVAPGRELTVQEAVDFDGAEPVMVKGYLIERAGELRLCSAILESYPPQCGDPSLQVEGDDLEGSEQQVSLLGTVEGERFLVSTTSR
jgi:hypothetical protein